MGRTKACTVAISLLLVLDFLWLNVFGTAGRFQAMAKRVGGNLPQWAPWQMGLVLVGAYILLGWGLCAFGVLPALGAEQPRLAAGLKGALLGLVIYGVYDLTNLGVFGPTYGLGLAACDVGWGVFVFTAACLGGVMAA